VREFVARRNRERGLTVILTTYDMDDIEALCSRVLVIGAGRIRCDGSLEAVRARAGSSRRVCLDLVDADETVSDPQARVIRREGARVVLSFDPREVPTTELVSRLTARHGVHDLFVENPPIEEVIESLYPDGDEP
jgi:ABC-2 type transport system ATP-binding protein